MVGNTLKNQLFMLVLALLLGTSCGGGGGDGNQEGDLSDAAGDVTQDAPVPQDTSDDGADGKDVEPLDVQAQDGLDVAQDVPADQVQDVQEDAGDTDDADVKPACKFDSECKALADVCKVGKCNKQTGECYQASAPNGTACDDGDPCNINDKCSLGVCNGGLGNGCEDGNVCTDDSCDGEGVCQHVANEGAVVDGANKNLEGKDVTVDGCFLTLSGKHQFKSFQVINGGAVNHPGYPGQGTVSNFTFQLDVSGDVFVDSISSINVNGRGYGSATGPGSVLCGSGATGGGGHGGPGGQGEALDTVCSGGTVNDSLTDPTLPGSGSGAQCPGCAQGNPGGGAVIIKATGVITVDGDITANGFGSSGWAGGGAGGTVFLKGSAIQGSGTIQAQGGDVTGTPYGGGGGGGRVALRADSIEFLGTVSAKGGSGGQGGGVGTIFIQETGQTGLVLMDGFDQPGAWTPVDSAVWTATGNHHLQVVRAASVVFGGGMLKSGDVLVSGASALSLMGTHEMTSLSVVEGGLITHPQFQGLEADVQDYRIDVKVLSSVLVDTVSRIDVNGLGYGSDQGPGASQVGPVTGGAAHGGNGGSASAEAYTTIGGVGYGSATQPIQLGSGSGRLCPTCAIGSAGGGAVKLEVGETLTLDGYILANGNGSTGWHGGGAGGSVWLKAAVFGGSGTISAEGGTVGGPAYAGGGGGGRVALYAGTDLFTGSISAAGGAGFQVGGAGTLFRGPLTGDGGLLLIDGKGLGGAATPLDASFWPEGQVFDLTVMQTAWVSTSGTAQFGSVQILTGSTWTVSDKKSMTSLEVSGGSVVSHPQYPGAPAAPEPYRVDLVVSGDVILAESSAFLADGLGYGSGQGPGGSNTCEVSGGAGYAGKGGDGKMGTLTCTGGNAYGSAEEPTQLGSGSGRVCMACPTMGSSGGGAVLLTVGSTFLFDGIISVDGTSSLGSVGGGSGGSVFIQAGTLVGEGEISANGGSVSNPPNYGGGGSGGRIAVYVPISDQFLGQMFAFGGTGNQAGAPGTVIFTN